MHWDSGTHDCSQLKAHAQLRVQPNSELTAATIAKAIEKAVEKSCCRPPLSRLYIHSALHGPRVGTHSPCRARGSTYSSTALSTALCNSIYILYMYSVQPSTAPQDHRTARIVLFGYCSMFEILITQFVYGYRFDFLDETSNDPAQPQWVGTHGILYCMPSAG